MPSLRAISTSRVGVSGYKLVKTSFGSKAETFPIEILKEEEVQGTAQHALAVENFSKIVMSGELDAAHAQHTVATQAVLDAMVLSSSRDGAWVKCRGVA